MVRLLSLTDLFPFLSLYILFAQLMMLREKKKKCLDVVDACPSSKKENDEVHMYIYMCICKTVIERITNIEKRLIINHAEQRIHVPVEYTYSPKHVKDRQMRENEKIFEVVLQ
jgi:hypothetical protein